MTRRHRRLVALAAAAAALLAAGAVWLLAQPGGVQRSPEALAPAFLQRWEDGEWAALDQLVLPPGTAAGEYERLHESLDLEGIVVEAGRIDDDGDRGRADFTATLPLVGLGEWSYSGRLDLVEADGKWWVDWSPSAIHPRVGSGHHVARTREWPERAPILDAGGDVLVGPHEVVDVGVEPRRIEDPDELLAVLESELGLDPDDVVAELERPGVQPDWFVPLTRLRPDEYEAVRPEVYPVPGTVFRRTDARITPGRDLATHVSGRTGEITAELLEEWGHPYVRGDVVGLSGLELVFQDRLGGRPSGDVQVVDGAGEVVGALHHFDGRDPEAVQTTLDVDVQFAAERALDGVDEPAALVAIDAGTGEIRAVVSRPADGFNRALSGRYPPGSTFKVVTAAAALAEGVDPSDAFSCPGELTVGGKPFTNAGGEALGSIAFDEAFARSCNTVFAPLAARVGAATLADAARRFGFGAEYQLPLPVAGGRFPTPADDAELAAAGIGQGRVEASPLHMASVAAAVAGGTWRAPVLIASESGGDERAVTSDVVASLHDLMRSVVESGTGEAAAADGRAVSGKTGSAEFGDDDPPRTHAWFVGFSEGLAASVFVEGGGSGGEVAAPVAARFFEALP